MTTKNKTKLISVLTPFYNEGNAIHIYFKTLLPILENFKNYDYEIICVDDGSKDDTFEILKSYHNKNKKIKIFKLSRNFGKEAALTACMQNTKGDAAIIIDADLQDPPQEIPGMIKEWENGYDVVLMKRKNRDEGLIKKWFAASFYWIINKLSESPIPKDIGDFRLMSKKAYLSVNKLNEKKRFMKGILSWVGFKSKIIEFDRPKRQEGLPKQNFKKLIKLAFDGIFAFSTFPIRIWTVLGFLIASFSFCMGIFYLIKTIYYGTDVPGYPSLIVSIYFLGGIQLMSLGIIGEYVGRTYDEIKSRPIYIISEKLE